jgi:hypothetical protein
MVGVFFFFFQFCNIVEVAIIHEKIKVNLAPKNEIKKNEASFYIVCYPIGS